MATAPTGAQVVLSRLSPIAKGGIGAGLFIVIAFGYWFIFYSDVAGKIEGAKRQEHTLHVDLDTAKQALADHDADLAELNEMQKRMGDLDRLLPPDSQEAAFLSSIQAASNVAGVDLKSYAPLEEQQQAFYAKVPMRLEFTGKFHQIAKFAYEVGKLDRIINVENIELSEPKLSGEEIIIKGKCLATAFHALKPKEGGPK